mmetsp:Transcript_104664/g.145940  ORF Transcript_104664/g.145940 Transcript_104664/m.145940 type:complete len:125 (-) Transcript_104664:85-459(-)
MEDLSHEQTFNQVNMTWDGGWSVSPSQPVNMSVADILGNHVLQTKLYEAALSASSKIEDVRASLGAANDALTTSATMESSVGICPSSFALLQALVPMPGRINRRAKGSFFLDGKAAKLQRAWPD